jgi:hypothetical protein
MPSHFPPTDHSHPAAVYFHHQAGTFQLEVQGLPTQAAGFEPAGTEISLLPASGPLRFTIPLGLFLHPDIYPLLLYILHNVLCVSVHNVYCYILIYSFPFFVACTSVQSASCCPVSYPKYLARSPVSMSSLRSGY